MPTATSTQSIFRREMSLTTTVLMAFLLALAAAGCTDKESQSAIQPEVTPITCDGCVQMVIVTDRRFYEQDQHVAVTATITVLTDVRLLGSLWCDTLSDFRIQVVDEHGQAAPWTGIGGTGAGCRIPIDVTQNVPYERSFCLDEYFDTSEPSRYMLSMSKNLSRWGNSEPITVQGEPVAFTRLP